MKKILLLTICILLNNQYTTSQQFTENTEISLTGILYGDVKWIDNNLNGNDQLLISGYDANYSPYSAMYSFETENLGLLQLPIAPSYFSSIGKLDYNNDGIQDFLINGYDSNNDASCKLYISDGNGSYTSQNLSIPSTTNGKIKTEDLNNDGLIDVIVTGSAEDYSYIAKLFIQNEDGNFIEAIVPFFGSTYSSISTFDANNDGHVDVLLTGFSNSYVPETKLYLNDGAANFTESTTDPLTDVYFSTTSAADYDNDNDIDILISGFNASFTPYTVLYNNDGSGNFSEVTNVSLKQLYWGTSNFADYDNDGDLDIFLSGADANTITYAKFYKNTNGIFTEDTNAEIGIYGTYVSAADWSDYDNDGDLDFVLSGLDSHSNAITKVYTNQQESLSIDDFSFNNKLRIYPNPTTEKIVNLVYDESQLSNTAYTVSIFSSLGQKVFETNLTYTSKIFKKAIDLTTLESGIYLLQLTSGNQSVSKKLILN
ncbi:T9SS type A sorting domain-containing protein [Winogradskyella costae]|uniref:T9SS type A sorting domain-containing protein n=1 Tax=Winogradskyella costae TaxID=2697008 RepID=UPI0015CE5B66|nr:T9SS type A sorting domain-containing protein [Winogradskyella costae]